MSVVPIIAATQMMNTANMVNSTACRITKENYDQARRRNTKTLSPLASMALVIGSSIAISILIVLFTCVIAANFNPNLAHLFEVIAANPACMYGIPLVLVIVVIGIVLFLML